jgi:uncharacterized membrane protein YidH (DUF202 family)
LNSTRLAILSIALNIFSLLVYTIAVANAAYRKFTLATEILSIMGIINLTLSIVALTRSLRQEEGQGARKIAWTSLAVAIGMIFVIAILSLNIWVYNFRT